MSVAFTKEEDSESAAAELPDRPISPHPNLVTPQGLSQLEAALAQARAAYAAAQAGGEAKPTAPPWRGRPGTCAITPLAGRPPGSCPPSSALIG
jgi:hypothetical protein